MCPLNPHSPDPAYWNHATLLELAILDGDAEAARGHLADALVSVREPWEPASTATNLQLIRDSRRCRGVAQEWLDAIIAELTIASMATARPIANRRCPMPGFRWFPKLPLLLALALAALAAPALAYKFPPITEEERALTRVASDPGAPAVVLFQIAELKIMDYPPGALVVEGLVRGLQARNRSHWWNGTSLRCGCSAPGLPPSPLQTSRIHSIWESLCNARDKLLGRSARAGSRP